MHLQCEVQVVEQQVACHKLVPIAIRLYSIQQIVKPEELLVQLRKCQQLKKRQ
jgi:hypothetical protein